MKITPSKMEESNCNGKRKSELMHHNQFLRQMRADSNEEINRTTRITDVNQHCLEHIFTYLDLKNYFKKNFDNNSV